ncbi:helix-turn-helix domain-containing protein [Clostridium intestinale]|uniref:Helix-turn-helix domain-containing protein n=1 Tax=Clostridium intestinale DSM 6191 TaxID=1121320 RepID=A0A1M6A529_9CLOT|nr:helix-turn-helix domain-containing protein [Clostridium intestinale]SHI31550.1 hypothetical protein SAMN02745941_03615 [Clostridium intestinale DSM 6191]
MLCNYEREFIKHNVLTSSEVAELIQTTRQRVSAIVKSGEIEPIKQTSQGMLFLRSDIEAYKKKKELGYISPLENSFNPIYDRSGNTHKSIEFFEKNIDKLDQIESIFIFFDEIDAAIGNFYTASDLLKIGELRYIETPHFIIKDINGQELWLGGCNCGYGGTGPHGSRKVLSILRDSKRLNSFNYSDEQIQEILYNRVVNIFIDSEGNTELIKRQSLVDESFVKRDFTARLYLFRHNLVLLQDTCSIWNKNDKYPLGVIEKYRAFIPNPQEIIVYPTIAQARDAGYIGLNRGYSDEEVYRLIIRDATGRELWLNPLITNEKPLYRQNNICELLNFCGFDFDIEDNNNSTTSKLLTWLNTTLRVVRPESQRPILIRKK